MFGQASPLLGILQRWPTMEAIQVQFKLFSKLIWFQVTKPENRTQDEDMDNPIISPIVSKKASSVAITFKRKQGNNSGSPSGLSTSWISTEYECRLGSLKEIEASSFQPIQLGWRRQWMNQLLHMECLHQVDCPMGKKHFLLSTDPLQTKSFRRCCLGAIGITGFRGGRGRRDSGNNN